MAPQTQFDKETRRRNVAIRFDDKVAIVTGAGGGLGRAHALEFARRGAKVVVNDLGGAMDGTGGSSDAADSVVEEIKSLGGEAIADGGSVTDRLGVKNMVKRAMNEFGRIDILINNAGILRDKSFGKMELDDFQAVVDVHLMGSVNCTKEVWPIMKEQQYGRIVLTTSVTGLYGNFGQTNYGAAKAALYGFMHSLKLEGQKDNIHVNTVAPIAWTRMTAGLSNPEVDTTEIAKRIAPELVSPSVMFLSSEEAPTGYIISAGGGILARPVMMETPGVYLGPDATAEDVAENFEAACALEGAVPLAHNGEQAAKNAAMTEKGKAET
jgi:NAD(P)-dependent dehydrogenase (short-subunit alcohol dehydrogenase family)